MTITVKTRKKLIEVSLPLEAINAASAREKSIRHGHPSTLHLWWARRPLAAARAVIFSQMVDDPSSCPEEFPTPEEQDRERERLHSLIKELVVWENTTNEVVLERAREEIRRSWRRTCADNRDHPQAAELFDPEKLPAFHDPFAGGGALPLEAQRLGLEAYASDLNPVAVLINKAMIEIPPKFAGQPPVNPDDRKKLGSSVKWKGAAGLAADVRYYGKWMRDEAEKRIGHLYPRVLITPEMVAERPDLKPYQGRELTVIAWLWARTVKSPNPAFRDVDVPLASTFMLSTKPGKEAYVEPVVEGRGYRFTVKVGKPRDAEAAKSGTKLARANFACVMSGVPIEGDYIKAEGMAKHMGARLMAIVAEGDRGRVYLTPDSAQESASHEAHPSWKPDVEIAKRMTGGNCTPYGLTTFGDLFTDRQLVALTTFSDLVGEAREQVKRAALAAGLPDDSRGIDDGGLGAQAYADAVAVYLGIALSRLTDICNALCRWEVTKTQVRNLFGRQAIPMLWDFAENNVFGDAAGDYLVSLGNMVKAIETLPLRVAGHALQLDAQSQTSSRDSVVSTDPPYYDNIGYADLSDFFYVWLRRSLRGVLPDVFPTVAVPKSEELVATPYRHGGKDKAEAFFLDGMTQAMQQLSAQGHPAFPVTIYYAFKQSETKAGADVASTGWETFLGAVKKSGLTVSGTDPMRTEMGNRMIGADTNALASSIVLTCWPRPENAPTATRTEFLQELGAEMRNALPLLTNGEIAPVDLAQASIGPGMAVYSKYSAVIRQDGQPVTVREALQDINAAVDRYMEEMEQSFDSTTRFCIAWYDQFGFGDGPFGDADTLSRAKNAAPNALERQHLAEMGGGKFRLLPPGSYPVGIASLAERPFGGSAWEACLRLVSTLEGDGGESATAALARELGEGPSARARQLAVRLFVIADKRKRSADAQVFNALDASWSAIQEKMAAQAAGGQGRLV